MAPGFETNWNSLRNSLAPDPRKETTALVFPKAKFNVNPRSCKQSRTAQRSLSNKGTRCSGWDVATGTAMSSAQRMLGKVSTSPGKTGECTECSTIHSSISLATDVIKMWNTMSANGLPGRVPRLVWRNCWQGREHHVSAWMSQTNLTNVDGAPKSAKSPGSWQATFSLAFGWPVLFKTSRTASRFWDEETPVTSSLTRWWNALERSRKRTALLTRLASAMVPKMRNACEPNITCCPGNPPNWPGALACSKWLIILCRRTECVRLAIFPSSRMPRNCWAVVGAKHFGMIATGPPLYESGSICHTNSFSNKSWYPAASGQAAKWNSSDGSGSSPVARSGAVFRNASSRAKSEGNSWHSIWLGASTEHTSVWWHTSAKAGAYLWAYLLQAGWSG